MSRFNSIGTLLVLFLFSGLIARAQLYPENAGQRGGGVTISDCDPSLTVDIEAGILGGYGYLFTGAIVPGTTAVQDMYWSYYTSDLEQYYGPSCNIAFPGPGEYPVCLTVNAYDLAAQQPCSTSVCALVNALPDSTCLDLVADFTIGSFDGQTFTFQDLSAFTGTIQQAFWSYGDATSASMNNTHTFDGPGPHEVCLTVIGEGPAFCSSTICKWLYFGPADLPCSEVLEPGFLFFQEGGLVGVLDTSITTGMNSTIDWDFGDGGLAEGRLAIHSYQNSGSFQLCNTVRIWGPLLSDTCATTTCITVESSVQVGVEEAAEDGGLKVWPNPFAHALELHLPGTGKAGLELFDPQGRRVASWNMTGSGTVALTMLDLPSGVFLLVCQQNGAVWRSPVLRE